MRFSRKHIDTPRSSRRSTPPPLAVADLPDALPPEPPESLAQPQGEPAPAADLPEELIAARAHEIWRRRGCPSGGDGRQDWFAARAELEQERLRFAAPRPSDRSRGI